MRSVPVIPAQRPGPSEGGGDISLSQVLATLRRGKWRIAAYVAGAGLLGG